MKIASAIKHIEKKGLLLVFPKNNNPEPASLWSQFYPRTKMRWEWDSDGDSRVSDLWMLMKRLSDSQKVVYSKWYQGRATFFSRPCFTALLALDLHFQKNVKISRTAFEILEALENDSPLSTKQLKKITELQGRDNEAAYNRAMKELFLAFKIVAYGEVDDGAFPSLAVAATSLVFEDLLTEAKRMPVNGAREIIDRHMPLGSAFRKFYKQHAPALSDSP